MELAPNIFQLAEDVIRNNPSLDVVEVPETPYFISKKGENMTIHGYLDLEGRRYYIGLFDEEGLSSAA